MPILRQLPGTSRDQPLDYGNIRGDDGEKKCFVKVTALTTPS
jgi:hypothetical protein